MIEACDISWQYSIEFTSFCIIAFQTCVRSNLVGLDALILTLVVIYVSSIGVDLASRSAHAFWMTSRRGDHFE